MSESFAIGRDLDLGELSCLSFVSALDVEHTKNMFNYIHLNTSAHTSTKTI